MAYDVNKTPKKHLISAQLNLEKFGSADFIPATEEEKRQQDVMSKSTTFFKDGMRRLFKNPLAILSLALLLIVIVTIIFAPMIVPYSYEEILKVGGRRDKDAQNMRPLTYSKNENEYIMSEWAKANGKESELEAIRAKSLSEFTDSDYAVFFGEKPADIDEWTINAYLGDDGVDEFLNGPASAVTREALSEYFDEKSINKFKKFADKNGIDLSSEISITDQLNKADEGTDKKTLNELRNLIDKRVSDMRANKIKLTEKVDDFSRDNLNVFVKNSVIKPSDYRFPHIFGTDDLCRDYFIRVIYGTRVSLIVGLFASIIVLIIGMIYGSVSGYFGGKVDLVMMRIVDVIYSLPDMLIIILLSVVLNEAIDLSGTVLASIGTNMISIFIVFGLLYWVGMARLIRGQILSIKQNEYILAARSVGSGSGRIIRKHILPNCISVIIISTALQIPSAIFTESYLSFVGLGVQVPMPSLGSLANAARGGLESYPYKLIFPALTICLIVLSLNLLGDGLRDAFDPKLKK